MAGTRSRRCSSTTATWSARASCSRPPDNPRSTSARAAAARYARTAAGTPTPKARSIRTAASARERLFGPYGADRAPPDRPPSDQNSPVSPTASRSACDSSTVRGLQPGSRRVHHQSRASSFSFVAESEAPGSQPFAASQRSRCSSDRRKTIVLQVKPMSSHQRRAGTRKWTSRSAPSTSSPFDDAERDRLTAACALRLDLTVAVERAGDAERVPRAGAVSSCALPHVTRCGVGAKQNGFAIQTSLVPGKEDERMRVVQAAVARLGLARLDPERLRRLARARRPAVGDDREVDVPTDVQVEGVHSPILSQLASTVNGRARGS